MPWQEDKWGQCVPVDQLWRRNGRRRHVGGCCWHHDRSRTTSFPLGGHASGTRLSATKRSRVRQPPTAFRWARSLRNPAPKTPTDSEDLQKGHGRIDRRHIEVLTPLKKTLNFAHVAQVFRVRRERTDLKSGEQSIEYAYGITSLAAEGATPQQLLAWNRGHWAIESKNHHRRDKTLCEDACTARSGLAPANRATCNNIVLALILHQRRWDNAAQALRYFTLRRSEAFKALLAPG